MGLPTLVALAAIAAVALADQGGLRGSAAQPWDYKSFHVGDWPEKGYHFCSGLASYGKHNEWQSPIDIPVPEDDQTTQLDDTNSLELSAKEHGCHRVRMVHNQHTWEANFEDMACTNLVAKWKGRSYTMQQLHFHVESENMLGGHHQEGEVHMVHQAEDGSVLVLAQFLKGSKEAEEHSPFLREVFKLLQLSIDQDIDLSGLVLNPYAGLLRKGDEIYSFLGSFTTPPCTPNVEWIVLREPTSISYDDMHTFGKYLKSSVDTQADSYGHDMRPVQPLNGRPILYGAISEIGFDL